MDCIRQCTSPSLLQTQDEYYGTLVLLLFQTVYEPMLINIVLYWSAGICSGLYSSRRGSTQHSFRSVLNLKRSEL
jgi:hypothetical protein